jgi:beta-mannosidase
MPSNSNTNDIDLAGMWQLSRPDGPETCALTLPGDVHSALIAAGLIPDPYVGRNEYDVRWVAEHAWVATRTFDLPDLDSDGWYLDIDGLDTVADVRVNGQLVLSAENCFRRYRPDVSRALHLGRNEVTITFHANVKAAAERQAKQPFYVPYAAQNCPIPHGNMLRKPACHFGWDWNLAICPFGLYGKIVVRRLKQVRIEHIQHRVQHNSDGSVFVIVLLELHGTEEGQSVSATVTFAGQTQSVEVEIETDFVRWSVPFKLEAPKLWWPAGQGDQHLYDLTVEVDGQVEHRKIGLRTIELLTDKDSDGTGSRFAFRVNGREIFAKGANWIPADALPSRATPELTEKLLRAAVDANMNMIRVWGGGFYEQDWFYDLCDRLGLMVWQDFMFSCNLYPSTPEFLAEVKLEVDYQVRRLDHHACIALWCGDNELVGALTWFKESRENRDRYLVSYDRLNRTIETAMRAAAPQANWWPSSPSSGPLNFGDAWHDDRSGDMHFWSVWHEGKDFEHYRDVKPRFCSEFGFQSFPSLAIAKQFATSADDLNIASPVMESHQKNAGGNARIAETMFRNFRFPMDFGNFVYLSQVQQGLAMRTAVEYWRSLKPHCMGTLYWQLNDTWPGASWSGLDHGGGWKAMHYMARRFYAPVAVFAIPDKATGDIAIMAVNDTGADVAVDVAQFWMTPAGARTDLPAQSGLVPPNRSVELGRIAAADIRHDAILFVEPRTEAGKLARLHCAPVPYKSLSMQPPAFGEGTQCSSSASTRASTPQKPNVAEDEHSVPVSAGALNVTITARQLALYVVAEVGVAGQWSDNVIDLLPDETVTITFTPDDPARLDEAAASLIIRDLYSSAATKKD